MKKIITMLLLINIIFLSFSVVKLSQAASTLPTIYYDGVKKEFIYSNVENNDLFKNLKEMMPGDTREQEILFKMQNILPNTKAYIKITESVDDKISDFLNIKVYLNDKELVSENNLIEIGDFSSEKQFKINIVASLSENAGNEISDLVYNIEWEFFIQENGEEILDVPQTFDSTNIYPHVISCIISLFIMLILICLLLKNKNKT